MDSKNHNFLIDYSLQNEKHTNIFSSPGRKSTPFSGNDEDNDDYDYEEDQCLSSGIESFHMIEKNVPKVQDPTDKKLSWLRSQVIGADAQIHTPFGRRRLTYADHTASGCCLHSIENCITNKLLPFYGNSHTSDSYVGHYTTKMVREATRYIKTCLGGGEKDAIIFCGSGSTAAVKRLQEVMGISIPSTLREKMLTHLSDEERWVVFVGPYEHHSNILSWRLSLGEVVEIGLDGNGLMDMDALTQELKFYKLKKRRIIGSFSACSNVTGMYSDTRAIACLFHSYGGFACFDFAASGPYEKIDMKSGEIDGYDAIFLSPHKFVGGPGSPGILLMNKALYGLGSSPPSTCGGGTVDFVNPFSEKDTLYVRNIEEREEAGTPAIIQKIRAALAFSIKEYIGYTLIESHEQMYITTALERLLPNPRISILGNTAAKRQAIMSFLVYSTMDSSFSSPKISNNVGNDKPLHGPFVAKLLNDLFGIQARGGCACAGPYGHSLLNVNELHSLAFRSTILKGYVGIKPGWTRVSFPYYMSKEEVEFILAAIEFIAVYGQRFLCLYHLNWKTGSWSFRRINGTVVAGSEKDQNSGGGGSVSSFIKTLTGKRDKKQAAIVKEYASSLAAAKRLGSLLPMFPPRRRIPEEIDINLVPFRI